MNVAFDLKKVEKTMKAFACLTIFAQARNKHFCKPKLWKFRL